MKKILTLVLLVFILSFYSCKDKYEGIGSPSIVWATSITNTSYIASIQPIIYKDKVFVSNVLDNGLNNIIVTLDKKTGKQLVETRVSPSVHSGIGQHYHFEDLLVFVNEFGIQCFDLNTSSIKWTMIERTSNVKQVDSVLFGLKNGKMVKFNMQTKEFKELNISAGSVQDFWTSAVFYDAYKNKNQDVCMTYIDTRNPQQYVLVSVNLSNSTLICKANLTNNAGVKGGFASFFKVKNDKVYFGNYDTLVCMNVQDGSFVWRQDLKRADYLYNKNYNNTGTEAFLGNTNLFIGTTNLNDSYLYAFDLLTGKQAWRVKNEGLTGFSSLDDFYYYHKTLYYASEELVAIDEDTGNIIWAFTNRAHTKSPVVFYMPPKGDDNLLYIAPTSKIMCIQAAQ